MLEGHEYSEVINEHSKEDQSIVKKEKVIAPVDISKGLNDWGISMILNWSNPEGFMFAWAERRRSKYRPPYSYLLFFELVKSELVTHGLYALIS